MMVLLSVTHFYRVSWRPRMTFLTIVVGVRLDRTERWLPAWPPMGDSKRHWPEATGLFRNRPSLLWLGCLNQMDQEIRFLLTYLQTSQIMKCLKMRSDTSTRNIAFACSTSP